MSIDLGSVSFIHQWSRRDSRQKSFQLTGFRQWILLQYRERPDVCRQNLSATEDNPGKICRQKRQRVSDGVH